MNSKDTAEWVSRYGILIALALLLSYLEAMIQIPTPVPGIKLGLANLVTIVGLYTVGTKGTAVVSLSRIVLTGLTFGNAFSMIYSLSGAVLSLLIMILAKKIKHFSVIGVSVLGGVGHNLGQLLVAALIVKTAGVFVFFPHLLVAGVIAGTVIGVLGGMIANRIQKVF